MLVRKRRVSPIVAVQLPFGSGVLSAVLLFGPPVLFSVQSGTGSDGASSAFGLGLVVGIVLSTLVPTFLERYERDRIWKSGLFAIGTVTKFHKDGEEVEFRYRAGDRTLERRWSNDEFRKADRGGDRFLLLYDPSSPKHIALIDRYYLPPPQIPVPPTA